MDDVSKLGPLWVSQLTKEVVARRNRAAESLLTVNPEGAYADQHRMLVDAANTMLAASDLMEALRNLEVSANSLQYCFDRRPENFGVALTQLTADAKRAREAIAKATGSAA